ncbi:hypothetical protein HETIRDRAFT_118458 [Heterobasidion irregulare TC 32-1]|uniref:N-acetyltransferase domain-containing protein n=1 Tax=Heterobasidion irregulare (strain TC 32-1) TaxID=747525 RepID=W4JV05_HETIT|nr:uncharacterized protein HETIRDRAFT_118458 [Heterobasidion irregulare TC 32-1]ETW77367.1 hypothetical protein HETIRDRAFT_118458 [Heterobasidion irregulare TC 32-1]
MSNTACLRIRSSLNSNIVNIFQMFNEYPVQTGAGGGNIVLFLESFKDKIKGWGDNDLLFSVVEEKDSLEFVGTIALWNIYGIKNCDANLGLTLREVSWGKGYGTELMTWLVDHGPREVFGKLWGDTEQCSTSTEDTDFYRTWRVTIGVYEIRASIQYRPMFSVSRLVLIAYLPDFHMVGQNAILHHYLATLVVQYLFSIFTGSPTPVPATYARAMDPERSGFCHC